MRVHDALRRAFAKYGAYADPWTLMELEQFVASALRGGSSGLENLVTNVEAVLARSEDPDARAKAREIVSYVLELCRERCDV